MKKKVPVKRRLCGCMEVHHRLLERDPYFRGRQMSLERATMARMAMAPARVGITTIPVVVHVVYNAATENISASQIKSQITALNLDYRAKNKDRSKVPSIWANLVSDTRIQFVLATKDPKGQPTTGITRTKTSKLSFSTNDKMKFAATGGSNAWPTKKYLNIWVCTLGEGLLGYAQFPGGPTKTDGVVILNTAFGTTGTASAPFKSGRTTTHEVGHWLNLRHIWGDTEDCSGSDFVADTPNAAGPNYGEPKFPTITCGNGPNGDMFMNYMDYVDDAAMFMFTTGQVKRMYTTLDGARSSIGT